MLFFGGSENVGLKRQAHGVHKYSEVKRHRGDMQSAELR